MPRPPETPWPQGRRSTAVHRVAGAWLSKRVRSAAAACPQSEGVHSRNIHQIHGPMTERIRDMQYDAKVFAAIIGGSAIVTIGALSAGIIEGKTAPASAAGPPQMTLGA